MTASLVAVSPIDAPSELTADPRTTAKTSCPLRCAAETRSSKSTPTPSDKPVPSAEAAKARHRPSADNARWRLNSTNTAGLAINATPPAKASEHSPARNDCTARCSATNDDEQAVSTVTAGPSNPKV